MLKGHEINCYKIVVVAFSFLVTAICHYRVLVVVYAITFPKVRVIIFFLKFVKLKQTFLC